jgi:hypothetical protein
MATLYARRRPDITITLRDASGREVEKSHEGAKWTESKKPFHITFWSYRGIQQIGVIPPQDGVSPPQLAMIEIDKCFQRTKPGRYELEVHLTLLKDTGDGSHLVPVRFPALKMPLDLPERTLPLSKFPWHFVILPGVSMLGICCLILYWLRRTSGRPLELPSSIAAKSDTFRS